MNRCVIFGGGEITDHRYIRNLIQPEDFLICADSGYSHCSALGIVPNLVLGDFDSYRGDVSKTCEIIRYDTHKDDTDTMLAVKVALERGYTDLVLLGMTGGRLDHTLANIQTLVYAVTRGARAWLVDKSCYVTALSSGQRVTVPYRRRYAVSVFSHTDSARGVTIQNAQYPLCRHTLHNSDPLGISNGFLENQDMEISVEQGVLVVISNPAT